MYLQVFTIADGLIYLYDSICTKSSSTYQCLHNTNHKYSKINIWHIAECIHSFIHTYKHTYTHAHIHTYINTYMHTYIHTTIHTYIHVYIHTYIHTYIHIIHTYIAININNPHTRHTTLTRQHTANSTYIHTHKHTQEHKHTIRFRYSTYTNKHTMDDTRTNMDIATNAPLMDVNTSIITKIHTPIQPNRSIQTHIGTPTHNYTSVIIS